MDLIWDQPFRVVVSLQFLSEQCYGSTMVAASFVEKRPQPFFKIFDVRDSLQRVLSSLLGILDPLLRVLEDQVFVLIVDLLSFLEIVIVDGAAVDVILVILLRPLVWCLLVGVGARLDHYSCCVNGDQTLI